MLLKGKNEENKERKTGMQLGERAVKHTLVQEVGCYTYKTFSPDNLMFIWPLNQSVSEPYLNWACHSVLLTTDIIYCTLKSGSYISYIYNIMDYWKQLSVEASQSNLRYL
jgi:hypothetical protein